MCRVYPSDLGMCALSLHGVKWIWYGSNEKLRAGNIHIIIAMEFVTMIIVTHVTLNEASGLIT